MLFGIGTNHDLLSTFDRKAVEAAAQHVLEHDSGPTLNDLGLCYLAAARGSGELQARLRVYAHLYCELPPYATPETARDILAHAAFVAEAHKKVWDLQLARPDPKERKRQLDALVEMLARSRRASSGATWHDAADLRAEAEQRLREGDADARRVAAGELAALEKHLDDLVRLCWAAK
ncbi:MAG TPA: hypothetical protein VGQ29_08500 [Gemmatimonadales bacterium]|jgi:hypothetical protein|nr:hypothetical protein [Gemmatimonadales bacterium]